MREASETGFKVVQVSDVPGASDYIRQAFQGTEVEYQYIYCPNADDIIAAAYDADVLMLVPGRPPVPRKVIENLPRCRYIVAFTTGYDAIDVKAATEQGMLVTNMPGTAYGTVADHTMALILACSRRIVELNQVVKNGEWVVDRMGSRLGREIWPKLTKLQGQTLGFIGFGNIARRVAPRAKGFEMRLIAFDPYVAPSVFDEFGVESVKLDQLLMESDFVSVHSPLSDETRGMLGLEQFKKMKPTAFIINTARGPIIDQEALYTALRQGLIAGAALDANEPEPSNPENNPLVSLDNVIMTPHSAAHGKTTFANMARRAPEQVFRLMKGEWPHDVVNPEVKDKYVERWGPLRA